MGEYHLQFQYCADRWENPDDAYEAFQEAAEYILYRVDFAPTFKHAPRDYRGARIYAVEGALWFPGGVTDSEAFETSLTLAFHCLFSGHYIIDVDAIHEEDQIVRPGTVIEHERVLAIGMKDPKFARIFS